MITKFKIFKIIGKDEKFDMPPPLENPDTGLKISFSKQNEVINVKLYQIIYTIEYY